MAQQFDPVSVAALLIALTQRAEGQQFSFTITNPYAGPLLDAVHPALEYLPRLGPTRALITWSAVYRSPTYSVPVLGQGGINGRVVGYDVYPGISRTFGPESAVCDPSSLGLAQGLMLLWAQAQFDLHDQRMKQNGRAPAKVP